MHVLAFCGLGVYVFLVYLGLFLSGCTTISRFLSGNGSRGIAADRLVICPQRNSSFALFGELEERPHHFVRHGDGIGGALSALLQEDRDHNFWLLERRVTGK